MASLICVMSEDQFLCSICLDVFTDPVTTPCGHSFCKTCLNKHWDNTDVCQCPVCKEEFSARPQLKTSTCLTEVVTQFKKKPLRESLEGSEKQSSGPGVVLCDVCSEAKAVKSCLVCLASYCQSHLQNHLTIPRLKRHQLIEPKEKLEDRLCAEHDKTLELFCRDDSMFVCLQCTSLEHKSHDAVPLKEAGEVEQANVKQMIEERRLKIEEIQKSVEMSGENSEQEIEKGVEAFNALKERVQQSLDRFKQDIEEKHNEIKEQAIEWIQELETEILELEKRKSEMEGLWCSEDHLHFLQTFVSEKPPPDVKDWTEVTPRVPSYEGTVAKALVKLRNVDLEDEIKEVLKAELRRVQQFAAKVTLDPNTAHPNLVLSHDHKQVYHSDLMKNLPNNSERFSVYSCVVGKQKFSTGQTYFEVKVEGKTRWYLGVMKESVNRKVKFKLSPQNGIWLIHLSDNCYKALDRETRTLDLKSRPKRIGIFVDYEEGIVCFYDVDTAELIYSFTNNSFTESLLPLFFPESNKNGSNFAPLVIVTPQTVKSLELFGFTF